jgi:uncharacterized protein
MIIDVSKIEESRLPFEVAVQPEALELGVANYRLKGPASAVGEITRHIGSIAVKGTIKGEAEIDCTRCLSPINTPLLIDFDVDYLTEGELGSEENVELQPGDLDTDELEGYQLDLTQLVREQILLNVPEQIYCTEDCKGLCEKCGGNLNLVDCNCKDEEIDPRWEALKNLKDNLN